jgi:ABC-type antimicrobial peptide transport system permease subunit
LTGDERPGPDGYIPLLQEPPRRPPVLNFLVRTATASPADLAPSLRRVVGEIAPGLPVYDVASMEERLARQAAQGRFVVLLAGAFTVLALILAAVGVYGLVSHEVAGRQREIAVRRALGAPAGRLLRAVAGKAARQTTAGLVLGIAAGWLWLPRLLRGLISGEGVAALHAGPPLLAAGVLLLTALLAALVPLRRALRLDPADELRRP